MKKVCILTSSHSPFDSRIFHKEAKTLAANDYKVALIVQHDKREIVDGVEIFPLPISRKRYKKMTVGVWKAFLLGLKQKADVYHFHDPALIPVGIALKLFGKRVIYDVHEDVPKQILSKEWIRSAYLRRVISFVFNIFEQFSTIFFDRIIAATPEIAKKFPEKKTI
ncbi:MAG: glycosyltransferase, partial [Candidatus Omnitrophica bacterium]|nr:glycosyltransferase [Candidatus Omnitrophota bacterium]